jgi:hypothetical protein
MKRLEKLLGRAYTLSAQVLNSDEIDIALAEEVSGECAELYAMLSGDLSSFDEPELIDPELLDLTRKLKAFELLSRATTMIYNIEDDQFQIAYERLENILDNLKETIR